MYTNIHDIILLGPSNTTETTFNPFGYMFTNTSGSAVYLKLHQDYLHHTQILTLTQLHTIYAIFGTYSEAPSRPQLIDNCINIKCY